MEIKKCETRTQWVCKIEGHSYVRTLIDWNDETPQTIAWHRNFDQVEGKTYLTEEKLEEYFQKWNVKPEKETEPITFNFEKFKYENVSAEGLIPNDGGQIEVNGGIVHSGKMKPKHRDGYWLTIVTPRTEEGVVEGIKITFKSLEEMLQNIPNESIMVRLVSLRNDYLRELKDVSCTDEKELKPMFQNMESYQEMITKHFLEYVSVRF